LSAIAWHTLIVRAVSWGVCLDLGWFRHVPKRQFEILGKYLEDRRKLLRVGIEILVFSSLIEVSLGAITGSPAIRRLCTKMSPMTPLHPHFDQQKFQINISH
jgi:hypothetical protein